MAFSKAKEPMSDYTTDSANSLSQGTKMGIRIIY